MNNSLEKYELLLNKITPDENYWLEIEEAKKVLSENVSSAFSSINSFMELKYIGSSATKCSLAWKKDLDCLVVLMSYDQEKFRQAIGKINGIQKYTFKDNTRLVKDKVDGFFGECELNMGCIIYGGIPQQDIGTDMFYHPDFTLNNLKTQQILEVLLLKTFFKSAEIGGGKLGGFAAEQMIVRYGSFDNFLNVLKEGKNIFIDFSGKYTPTKEHLVVSYPYCGLENLVRITEEDFNRLVEYAGKVCENSGVFVTDGLKITEILEKQWKEKFLKH